MSRERNQKPPPPSGGFSDLGKSGSEYHLVFRIQIQMEQLQHGSLGKFTLLRNIGENPAYVEVLGGLGQGAPGTGNVIVRIRTLRLPLMMAPSVGGSATDDDSAQLPLNL